MGWALRGPALTKAAQRIAPSRQGALHCGHISKKGRMSAHPNEAMLGPVLCHKIDLLTREESNPGRPLWVMSRHHVTVCVMSVIPLKADIRRREWHVRYVPILLI